MTNEMYTHENESADFRLGFRDGLEKAREIAFEYLDELRQDFRINEACWVDVLRDRIDDELSMYVVGDEE